MKQHLKAVFAFVVLIAGFLNAGGMAIQAVKLFEIKDPTGFSIEMYGVFLFIQAVYAVNGVKHKDKWQAAGMFLSMVPTSWIIGMICWY